MSNKDNQDDLSMPDTDNITQEFSSGLDAFQKRKETFLSGLIAARQELEDAHQQTRRSQVELDTELKAFRQNKKTLLDDLEAAREELERSRKDWEREQARVETQIEALYKERDALIGRLKGAREKIEEITRVADDKGLARMLFPLLRDTSPTVRKAATAAAANLRSPEMVMLLIQRMDDPVADVRQAALDAVRAITGRKVVDSIPDEPHARQRLIRRLRDWWQSVGGETPRERRNLEEL